MHALVFFSQKKICGCTLRVAKREAWSSATYTQSPCKRILLPWLRLQQMCLSQLRAAVLEQPGHAAAPFVRARLESLKLKAASERCPALIDVARAAGASVASPQGGGLTKSALIDALVGSFSSAASSSAASALHRAVAAVPGLLEPGETLLLCHLPHLAAKLLVSPFAAAELHVPVSHKPTTLRAKRT